MAATTAVLTPAATGSTSSRHMGIVWSTHSARLQARTAPAPAGAVPPRRRAEWVDQTMPMWRELVEPVAAGVSTAVVAAMRSQMGQLGSGEEPTAIPGLPAGLD